jgi:hypothetical protein
MTGKWTVDSKFTVTVKELGKDEWAAVALMVPSRTNIQCRQG